MSKVNVKNPIATFPILVARADNAPPGDKRPRMKENIVNKDGKPVERPDLTPEEIALEGNPNLMYEHWDEFWRKVHGPRVMYKDGPDDNMCDGVHMYNQVHRVAGAPSSLFPPPYPALADAKGALYNTIWDKVPKYERTYFDGLVYWAAGSVEELIPIGNAPKAVNKVNNEGWIFNRYQVGSMCAEYVIIPFDEAGLPPICTVKVHFSKDGDQKTLQDYLLHEHADIIANGEMAKKYIKRFAYIFNINKSPDEPYYSEWGVKVDAISVTYFKNMEDCELYYGSEEYTKIEEKEATLLDLSKSEWWTGIVYPFVTPEQEAATDRNTQVLWERPAQK